MPCNVYLNGAERSVESSTLAELLQECGLARDSVATALNGEFVRKQNRSETTICEGDRIEVVSPLEGG